MLQDLWLEVRHPHLVPLEAFYPDRYELMNT